MASDPCEPDRFDAQAEDVFRQFANGTNTLIAAIAAALREAEASALERAAQRLGEPRSGKFSGAEVAAALRSLMTAAAPTPPAITYVNAEQWAAAGQPPLDDMKPREPGCQCHQEEGDSPCLVHGEEPGKAQDRCDQSACDGPDAPDDADHWKCDTHRRKHASPLDELAAVLRGKDEMGEKLAKALGVPAGPLGRLVDAAVARIAELEAQLNTPELHDFAKGVVLEAAHQRARWGTDHDGGKEPSDWFWLVGYLAGKALHAHAEGRHEKALHHTITAASALSNWHAGILGKTNMRPGIEPPALAAPADGLYVCEHCPDHPHPLNDDGTKCKFPRPAPAAETGKAEVSNVIGRAPDLVGLPCGCLKDRFNQYIARCLRHPPPEQIATPAPAQGLLIAARAAPPERGSR